MTQATQAEDGVLRDDEEEQMHQTTTKMFDREGIYLSGPIRCVSDNGVIWRDNLIEDYPHLTFHNPLDNESPEEKIILNDAIHFDPEAEKEQVLPEEYVADDKFWIDRSECMFVGLPDEIARGTSMEMMYSYFRGIPFFVWTIDGQEESGWIYHHAEFMSDDREEVMKEVKKYVD